MHDSKEEMADKPKQNISYRGREGSEKEKTKSEINAEYFQALEQWLNSVRSHMYSCNFFAGFPYTMMAQQMGQFPSPQMQNGTYPPLPGFNQSFGMFMFPNQQQQQQPEQTENAIEYTIPPLWKRGVAETVDFILLLIMKIALTFIAVDFLGFIDLNKYISLQETEKLDMKVFLQFTSDITLLEVAHKLIVCLYEGIFLRKGIQNQIGGATPGKTFMGIRVILCNSVEQVENRPNVIKVISAKDLGLGWSFARAILKNVVLALLIPIYFPYLLNKFNRTAYDLLCHSVVVEDRVQSNRNR